MWGEVMISFASSWSGGKDACLATYRMIQAGNEPRFLLTMMEADGKHSRAHALPRKLLQAQADALNIPLFTQAADNYKDSYIEALNTLKTKGITDAVFGDIDLQAHKDWQEEIAEIVGFTMHFPLWEEPHDKLVYEFIDAGFITTIIAVQQGVLGQEFLGRALDQETLAELEGRGIDICGEGGEFHTFVTDGPIFSQAVTIRTTGIFSQNGYDFLKL